MSISINYRSAALAAEAAEAAVTAARHAILAACAAGASADVLDGASVAVDRIDAVADEIRQALKDTPMFEPEAPAPEPEPEEEAPAIPEAQEAPEPARVIVWQHPLAAVLQDAEADEHEARRTLEAMHDAGADEAEIADAESALYYAQTAVDAARAELDAADAEPPFARPEGGSAA